MEAMVNGYGPVGKPASFAVKILDKYGNEHKRVVPTKLTSKYQAELAAIKYVLHAVPHKDVSLTVKTSVKHIPQIFKKTADGKWVKRKKNKLIDEIRSLSEHFASFECVSGDEEEMAEVKEMARLVNSI